jgi:MoaA/NifB/PqqE/SkfB family radical SAM enzyme
MKVSSFFYFANFWLKTVLFKKKDPILGTVIVTDRCNLKCKHCSVNNITSIMHPYTQIKKEMQTLYDMGTRILFFCGGETFLWRDGDLTVRDLVIEAKRMGFMIVNVVTNGTQPIDLPEADLILLSLDGDRERHNAIRGNTFDTIMENVKNATADNICFYMAINQINKDAVQDVCQIAMDTKNVRAVSFNFHTPYPDTRNLFLSKEEKQKIADTILQMMDKGYPIFNLKASLPYLVNNSFPTPCYQCLVIEDGKISVCGRCIDVPGLCEECGYFFVAEYTLLFRGNLKIIFEMLKTYLKYIYNELPYITCKILAHKVT